jgi:hypothetical protein
MRNIVFIMDVDLKGTGRWASERTRPYQYSIKSWEHWCKRNDCDLFILNHSLVDHTKMGLCWQRYYLFDILDSNGIEYDQIAMVDADTIVHPDCPNFFELTNHKFTAVHNDGSYDWVLRSIENYSHYMFDNYVPKFWNYINCGFMVVNSTHKSFFKHVTDFYWNNNEAFKQLETLHVGTDQTPVNIMLELENIDLQMLPYEFNMVDMVRKEILSEDMLFTTLGYIYQFNCIPNNHNGSATYYWMQKTYNYLYENGNK